MPIIQSDCSGAGTVVERKTFLYPVCADLQRSSQRTASQPHPHRTTTIHAHQVNAADSDLPRIQRRTSAPVLAFHPPAQIRIPGSSGEKQWIDRDSLLPFPTDSRTRRTVRRKSGTRAAVVWVGVSESTPVLLCSERLRLPFSSFPSPADPRKHRHARRLYGSAVCASDSETRSKATGNSVTYPA